MVELRLFINSMLILRKMSASLVATGWWMYVDVALTPKAVVVCVILFNAFFGYRLAWKRLVLPPLTYLFLQLGPRPVALSSRGALSLP